MRKLWSYIFGNTDENKIKNSENNNDNQGLLSKHNWIGPDGTESGPDVPEDWYLSYNGPAPIVEEILAKTTLLIGEMVLYLFIIISKNGAFQRALEIPTMRNFGLWNNPY